MEHKHKARCYDCEIEYGGLGWIEAIIPDKVWDAIRPDGTKPGNGLLCINCISKRLAIRGYSKVPVWLCGQEPLRAMSGGADEEPNLFLLRNWNMESKKIFHTPFAYPCKIQNCKLKEVNGRCSLYYHDERNGCCISYREGGVKCITT